MAAGISRAGSDYDLFLKRLLDQLNAGRRERLAEELAKLRAVAGAAAGSVSSVRRCAWTSGSLIHVERNVYSVPSRLIGEKVDVRLYVEHVEVWYAQQLVERLPRLRGRDKDHINYRHIIDWLVRKPGAFAHVPLSAGACSRRAISAWPTMIC